MTPAPILLFVYNRPDHAARCIESLLQNEPASSSPLYIYSDGPKDDESREGVEQTRRLIHEVKGFASVTIIEQRENRGLAQSIIEGVTEQVSRHGSVIVVEDDLIAAPGFLQFMNDALETYKNESQVGHIQACDFTQDPSLPPTFFIQWTGSWGWGTWDRAWKLFNPNGSELLRQLEERKLTYRFDFNGAYGYTRMLRRQIAGKNNSWAIRWNASLFLADVLSLNAGRSLIRNTGFDGSGTNCGGGGLYDSTLWMNPLPVEKLHPITENREARKAFIRYYRRTNSFWAKVIRRIRRTLKGDFGA